MARSGKTPLIVRPRMSKWPNHLNKARGSLATCPKQAK
jgi:hypothetical protein